MPALLDVSLDRGPYPEGSDGRFHGLHDRSNELIAERTHVVRRQTS